MGTARPSSPAQAKPRANSSIGSGAAWLGINISVPASMAWFPFDGWNESFFGDLHIQGREGVHFFTQQKVTMTRWFSFGEGDVWQH
jgi:malonate-semialdehyde dehydrogenase (acetylating)/methylmalonate-semialdehyde dehydrogenase